MHRIEAEEEEVFRSSATLTEDALHGPDGEFFARISSLLWSRRHFLIRVAVVGMLAGLLTAFLIPPQYDSTVRLMPPDSSSSSPLSLLSALASGPTGATGGFGMVSDFLGMKTSGALFLGILQS